MATFLETEYDVELAPSRWWLVTLLLLLLLQFFARSHDILALPANADESLAIHRADVAWEFTTDDQASWIPGKLLLYYYLGLFETANDHALAVARWAVALFSLISTASLYQIGRRLFNYRVGLLAAWMYVVIPFAQFFDRMALAGSFAVALLLMAVWAILIWLDHPTQSRSIMTAIMMILAPLGQLALLGIAIVPLLSVILFGKRNISYKNPLLTVYAIFGVAWLVMLMPVIVGEVQPEQIAMFDDAASITQPEQQGALANLGDNIWDALDETAAFYWAPALVITAAAALVLFWLQLYRAVFLGGLLAITWLPVIAFGADPAADNLLLGVPFLLLMLVGGIFESCYLMNEAGRRHAVERMLIFSFLIYGLSWGMPFMEGIARDPQELLLSDGASLRYIRAVTSGYGHQAAASYLLDDAEPNEISDAVESYAVLEACSIMDFYLEQGDTMRLVCLDIDAENHVLTPEMIRRVETDMSIYGWAYMLVERGTVANMDALPVEWEFVRLLPRPLDGTPIEVWKIMAPEEDEDDEAGMEFEFPPVPESNEEADD